MDDLKLIRSLKFYVGLAAVFMAIFGIGGGMLMYFNDLKVIGVIWTILGSFFSIALPVKALHHPGSNLENSNEIYD
ncbi:MAG: hypothetical protein LRY73_19885 [Bacillus sp. (in: Bacteria)]|nr:hypothetical protein [Bacillus sp. (in: firmicutes)]